MPNIIKKSLVRQWLLLLCLNLLVHNCFSQNYSQVKKTKESIGKAIMDTIRKSMHITDSVKVIDTTFYGRDTIRGILFIDYNRHSRFHPKESIQDLDKRMLDYSQTDTTVYKDTIPVNKDSIALTKKTIPRNLLTAWIPVYKYKKEFYLYQSCDLSDAKEYRITDTMVKFCYLEYVLYQRVRKITINKDHSIAFHFPSEDDLNMKLIDNTRSIYIVNDGQFCHYYIPIEKASNFPIILSYCNEEDAIELQYESPKCK